MSSGRVRAEQAPGEKLSLGVAARLSRYLQVLTQARKMGKETISSQELADYTHVNSTQIRRDLSGFGKFGKRGVGYNVESLVSQIRKILRTAGQHNIALFGAGHLGHGDRHLGHLRRPRLPRGRRCSTSTAAGGHRIGSLAVRHNSELRAVVDDQDIVVAVLAVPSAAAQKLADELVDAGVKIIFNYSEALLQVPPEVTVHTSSPAVDLLYALYFYLTCVAREPPVELDLDSARGGFGRLHRLHRRPGGGVRPAGPRRPGTGRGASRSCATPAPPTSTARGPSPAS